MATTTGDMEDVVALRFDEQAIAEDLAQWCGGFVESVDGHQAIRLPAIGPHDLARPGYWIVLLPDGRFIALPPDEFAARFEPRPADTP